MDGYEIRFGEYDDSMLDRVVTLFKVVFNWTDKFSKEYLEWQYLKNPNGTVVSYNAFANDGSLAAHYAAIPIRMMIGGKIEKGLLSLNTATHPLHQGHGLFTNLATQTYQYARDCGYKYVIGVANANSTHGFLKYLGFEFISPLEFKIGMGNIFRQANLVNKNHMIYDHETLMWRLQCPAYVYSANDFCIYGKRPEFLFHSVVLKLPSGETRERLGLKKTHSVFNIYVGLGLESKSGLYFNLPKFIKRSPFNLIFKDMSDGQLPKITRENVSFQLLDFDVA